LLVRRRRDKKRGVGFISLLFGILYGVLAFSSIGLEASLEPLRPVEVGSDLTRLQLSYKTETENIPFMSASKAGYFTDEGAIDLVLNRTEELVISKNFWVYKDQNNDALVLHNIRSGARHSLNVGGFPFLIEDQLFIIRPDQQAISSVDNFGKVLWTIEFGSIITSADVNESYSAWGTLRGTIRIIARDGASIAEIRPDAFGLDARHSCIYSVALSKDGLRLAVLYGLDPQYVAIFSNLRGVWTLDHKERMEGSIRKSAAAAFSGDSRFFVMQTSQGLMTYSLQEKEKTFLMHDHTGDPNTEVIIRPIGTSSFAFLSFYLERKSLGLIVKHSLKAFFPVEEDSVSLDIHGANIYIAGDSAIRRFLFREGSDHEE
jgi:hypothetical protein